MNRLNKQNWITHSYTLIYSDGFWYSPRWSIPQSALGYVLHCQTSFLNFMFVFTGVLGAPGTKWWYCSPMNLYFARFLVWTCQLFFFLVLLNHSIQVSHNASREFKLFLLREFRRDRNKCKVRWVQKCSMKIPSHCSNIYLIWNDVRSDCSISVSPILYLL